MLLLFLGFLWMLGKFCNMHDDRNDDEESDENDDEDDNIGSHAVTVGSKSTEIGTL